MGLAYLRPCQLDPLYCAGVLDSSHAADQVKGVAVDASVFHVGVVDVNGNDLAYDEAASVRSLVEVEDLVQLAFEADGRLRNTRGTHHARRLWREFCEFEFVDIRWIIPAGNVHWV